jgi:hypothetical protein
VLKGFNRHCKAEGEKGSALMTLPLFIADLVFVDF